METKSAVYCLKNLKTGEKYVGVSTNWKNRIRAHRGRLKAGKHHAKKLQAAWDVFSPCDFEWSILEYLPENMDYEEREYKEIIWMEKIGCEYNSLTPDIERSHLILIGAMNPDTQELYPDYRQRVLDKQKEAKQREQKEVSVSKEGWTRIEAIAKQLGCSSVSELLEKIGRGEIQCSVCLVGKNHYGSTPEEQLEKNQPAMEWAKTRLKELKGKQGKE